MATPSKLAGSFRRWLKTPAPPHAKDGLWRPISPSFNTTALEAGMCCYPCFLPWQKAPVPISFFYKIPHLPKYFSLVFQVSNRSPLPLLGPEWPAMYPKITARICSTTILSPRATWLYSAGCLYAARWFQGKTFPFQDWQLLGQPTRPGPPHSVSPESSLLNLECPYLVAGDFNIHNSATDPSRLLFSKEERESALTLTRPHINASPSSTPQAFTPGFPLQERTDLSQTVTKQGRLSHD